MKYKLIISDYDGTLLQSRKTVSERTVRTITEYVNKGGKFVVSTGRALRSILPIVKNNNIDYGYVMSYNGSVLYDTKTDKELLTYSVPSKVTEKVAEQMEKDGIVPQVYINHDIYTAFPRSFTISYEKVGGVPVNYLGTKVSEFLKGVDLPSTKVLGYVPPEKTKGLIERYTEIFKEDCQFVFSNKSLFECVNKAAGKGNTAAAFCKMIGVLPSEVMAFGDSINDASMIEFAGLGVAMGNGEESLKNIANYVAENVEDDGVAKTIEKFCLED